MNFIKFNFILVKYTHLIVSEKLARVIVNSVHNVIIVGIRLHVINCKRNCSPGFHVDVVAQLLSTETMTKTIMSPFRRVVKYLFK